MKVWGLDRPMVIGTAHKLGLEVDNFRRDGKAYAFRLIPESSKAKYARRSASGRALKATCYHGFRDFISVCFSHGATRVQSATGNWYSETEFVGDLRRIRGLNIGSQMYPVRMVDLCECAGV